MRWDWKNQNPIDSNVSNAHLFGAQKWGFPMHEDARTCRSANIEQNRSTSGSSIAQSQSQNKTILWTKMKRSRIKKNFKSRLNMNYELWTEIKRLFRCCFSQTLRKLGINFENISWLKYLNSKHTYLCSVVS